MIYLLRILSLAGVNWLIYLQNNNVIYVRIWFRESNIILNYENNRAADIVGTCVVVIRWQMVLRCLGRFIFPAIVAPDLKQFRLSL